MSDPNQWGTGRPAHYFQRAMSELGGQKFQQEFAHPVLVHHGEPTNALAIQQTAEAVIFVHAVRLAADQEQVSLGRLETNDIFLPHPTISGVHAWLRPSASLEEWQVLDNGSRNGTFVDDESVLVDDAAALEDGVALRIGSLNLTWLSAEMFSFFLRNYS
ncbi:MAG: FHA domain-containing protein [Deltaproteobacteria bacterium]|nr:FHA domain-containing protein [Deltaproteobacteria bacterium]